MLSVDEGLNRAAEFLSRTTGTEADSVRINRVLAFTVGQDLVVPWNTKALLDDGDEDAEIAGNPDILVDLVTSECRYLDLIESDNYRRHRDNLPD